MKQSIEKLMKDYLNLSGMTNLCRGHCEVIRKNLDSNPTSIVLQCKELSYGFVIPEDSRKFFMEQLLDTMFRITTMQNSKTLKALDKVKRQLKHDSKEFDIL